MAETGQITGEDQLLAIVLDGKVESAPRVLEQIAGRQRRDHRQLHPGRGQEPGPGAANRCACPWSSTPVSQNTIGATLGKAALNQALLAGAIGLLLIMVFMIAYYRLLGVVASIALIIYGVLFMGILNAIGVTMTLPGIAGMILTLGMAVDANVLIFARMRDEVAAGKTIGAATSAGFKKAFRAVFDCNMTTIITAIILFWAASGGIKGFALTLGVGVALSMFTAVARDPVHAQPAQRVEAVPQSAGCWACTCQPALERGSSREIYPLHALQVVVPGHPRRGHGVRHHHHLRRRPRLRHRLQGRHADGGRAGAGRPPSTTSVPSSAAWASRTRWCSRSPGPAAPTRFMITAAGDDRASRPGSRCSRELDSKFGTEGRRDRATETVGASFGKETTNRAFIACAIAILAIIGYLTFRFEFKFAIPAIVALLHDVGLTLGIYAASNRLVTTATVAAILTILGYSVHDTIIVFDRMRENTLLMKKETYGDMVDLSITQTMVRSINTSIALLLPLLAILIFGGPTLKDFAFALTIGVLTGTYSSFFVASPLVVLWKEREPRYRKRLALAGAGAGGRRTCGGRRDRRAATVARGSGDAGHDALAECRPRQAASPTRRGASQEAEEGQDRSEAAATESEPADVMTRA